MEKIKKIFNVHIFLLFFILFSITFFVAKFLSYNTIAGDDMWQIFFVNDFLYELTHPDHGRYLAWMQMKFFGSWLPQFLGIHPQNFISCFPALVRAINIAVLCLSVAYFSTIRNHKNFLLHTLTIFVFVYYSANLITHNIAEINNLSPHFGYQFGLMIYLVFWIILLKYLLNDSVSKLNVVICSVVSFLSALNDAFAVMGIISLSFFIIFGFLKKIFVTKRQIVAPVVSFLVGAFLSLYGLFLDKHVIDFMDSEENINFFFYWFEMLKKFIPQFLEFVFLDHIFIHVFIIVFFILCFKQNKDSLFCIIALSMYFGILGFFASLITGGTETFYQKGLFWIAHNDLQLILRVILFSIFLLLFGEYSYFSKVFSSKKYKFILVAINFVFLFLSLMHLGCFNAYIDRYKLAPEVKKQAYIAEKMYLFYAYQNKEAYLPINLLSYSEIASSFWVGMSFNEEVNSVDLFEINANNPEWKERDNVVSKIKSFKMDKSFYVLLYMPKIYSLEKAPPFYFVDQDEAYSKFNSLGGKFSDEELQNIDFNKLYDIDFVLNRK